MKMEKEFLYSRGFYSTNANLSILFYDIEFWNTIELDDSYKVYVHKKQICNFKMGRYSSIFDRARLSSY